MDAGEIQAIASVATFFSACLAVWATFRAPRIAAEFAEKLRAESQVADERRRLKLFVFTNLLQYRAQMAHPNAVAALNLIDVVYIDSREVRDAWRDFNRAAEATPFIAAAVAERYHALIEKMARDLGLHTQISISDIRLSYYPKGLGELDELAYLETQDKLSRFRGAATEKLQP